MFFPIKHGDFPWFSIFVYTSTVHLWSSLYLPTGGQVSTSIQRHSHGRVLNSVVQWHNGKTLRHEQTHQAKAWNYQLPSNYKQSSIFAKVNTFSQTYSKLIFWPSRCVIKKASDGIGFYALQGIALWTTLRLLEAHRWGRHVSAVSLCEPLWACFFFGTTKTNHRCIFSLARPRGWVTGLRHWGRSSWWWLWQHAALQECADPDVIPAGYVPIDAAPQLHWQRFEVKVMQGLLVEPTRRGLKIFLWAQSYDPPFKINSFPTVLLNCVMSQ